jgi:transposase, IS30 family
MTYKQLTEVQRYQIAALKKTEKNHKEIAKIICISEATISRELKRNRGKKGYRPKQANQIALARRRGAKKAIKMTSRVIALIEEKLKLEWSPEQISGWFDLEHDISISHECIYQHIWSDKYQGGDLFKYLRFSNKKRKKQYGSTDKRGQIRNRITIDERPEVVEHKSRLGDWEIDTVIGKNHKGALVTIVERKSKLALIKKVKTKQAQAVTHATVTLLKPYLDKVLTITADNGKEFSDHQTIAKALDVMIYFAHPYSSWERGLNENTNGLIRQYFPKGSSFEEVTDEQVQQVMDKLNHQPRKMLNPEFKS